jgi:uncharacterized oligopeptide transporter (OPT) family protein
MAVGRTEYAMRYHKATAISQSQVDMILGSAWTSLNSVPVLNLFDRWFDVRRMTSSEMQKFTNDWVRAIAAEIKAGIVTPH